MKQKTVYDMRFIAGGSIVCSSDPVGLVQTFFVSGARYFCSMLIGAFAIRIPAADWKPDGWTPPANQSAMISRNHVHIDQALKTPQFWLLRSEEHTSELQSLMRISYAVFCLKKKKKNKNSKA